MVPDPKIIIFSWSCDPFLQDHQNKWSHGYDLVFFMISWFWSWRFHDLLPQNPWSGDPTHGNSMIRWSHSPNFHDLVISPSEIQPLDPWSGDFTRQNQNSIIRWSLHLFFVTHLVFKSDPKVHWISTYASMIFFIVVINRNSLFPPINTKF